MNNEITGNLFFLCFYMQHFSNFRKNMENILLDTKINKGKFQNNKKQKISHLKNNYFFKVVIFT